MTGRGGRKTEAGRPWGALEDLCVLGSAQHLVSRLVGSASVSSEVHLERILGLIVHKTVAHQPTLTMPAGFTTDNLPVGITFLGRAYAEPALIRLAFGYEQATNHSKPPSSAPPLPRGL